MSNTEQTPDIATDIKLNTATIRRLYNPDRYGRTAVRVGLAVLQTVNALCDEHDRLTAENEHLRANLESLRRSLTHESDGF